MNERTRFFPGAGKIRAYYRKGWVVPLALEVPFEDPLVVYRRFYGRGPTVFLDSTRFHPKTGTHSYLCVNPIRILDLKKAPDPMKTLRTIFSTWRGREWPELAHFTGGAVGFLSYELSQDLAPLRIRRPAQSHLPKIRLLFTRDVVVFDLGRRRMRVVTNLLPGQDGSFANAYCEARHRLESVLRTVSGSHARKVEASANGHSAVTRFRSNLSQDEFERMVRRAKAYIRAGDIYQANLSQRFSFTFKGDPLKIYERLREINPSPFSSFLDFGGLKVISCSPERLIRLRGRTCDTRPIAGTRPAGRNPRESRRLCAELLLSKKERAEHLMLLDLERNDLGRVCEYRSVRVNEMMALEKYSHVTHIVSNVVGRLASGRDRFDLLEAVFPGGTITGCPKIRCMEIIDELEGDPRGLYTGSIGYLDFNGNMDWNIVIRTLVLEGRKGVIQVGAGIVHDSRPGKEYEETLHKGRALLEALVIPNGG